MKELKQFEFKYEGENFIDLNTLITSQFHFLAAVNEIQNELYRDVELKLKVGAFSEGSFIVDLLMETSWKDHLFTKENAAILGGIVGTFASLIEIHKYLKGRKADQIEESGDNITITVNGDNNSITVNKDAFNLYKDNVTINKSIQQNFELLDKDSEIGGVEIKERETQDKPPKKPILRVERDEFQNLSSVNPYLSREVNHETHSNQNLFIKKANLIPDKKRVWKWEFIHKGRDISANVTDWDFATKINSGLKIGQGDRLIVDLKIGYKFSEQFNTFIESGYYEVVKIKELIPRPDQSSMKF